MLLSNLIEQLQMIKDQNGDLTIKYADYDFLVDRDPIVEIDPQWTQPGTYNTIQEKVVKISYESF